MEEDEDFSLDEARETLFTLQRACERHAAGLAKVVDALNSKQPEDEWLLEVLEEATKGTAFHQQQLDMFTAFHGRVAAYVDAVRNEANQLALLELSGKEPADGQEAEGGEAGAGEEGAAEARTPPPAGGPPGLHGLPPAGAGRRKSSKVVHPELLKFKLEKQAKILGKYGGIPALGAGLVLPRLQRDSILKATGSPAAREIHYSKVEGRDAPQLAEVMRFKARRKDGDENGGGGTPAPSPWQAELSAKKGKQALDGTDAKDQVTPSTRTHTAYAEELGGVLQQRQAALEAATAAEKLRASAGGDGGDGPLGVISAAAGDELAAKLKRRQSAAAQAAAEAAAAEAEAAEAAAPPATPSWSNAAAPFGGELTAALQRRAEARRQQAEAETAGAEAAGAAAGARTPSGGGGGSGLAATPSTPVFGLVTPSAVAASRHSAPPMQLAGLFATPPPPRPAPAPPRPPAATPGPAGPSGGGGIGGGGGGVSNELQEKLRRRLSNLETAPAAAAAAAPPPSAEAAAVEAQ